MASPRSRGRPYGVMLLLAFAAATVGIMAVQKLRERRVYNILINEKDREVMALNMRYQREKGLTNELKVKIEELKAKIESLRNQKFALKDKLLEMQSLTASLQEKRRALSAEVEEKQKQIENLSRRKGLSRKMYTQLIALREALKHKEDEIHELKHQNPNLQFDHSASSNETAGVRPNLTATTSVLDAENSTDTEQESHSKGQEKQIQSQQDGEGPRQGDQSKGINTDGAGSTKRQPADVEPVSKEQGNETLTDVKADRRTEYTRRDAVKEEVNVDAGDKISLKETPHAANVIKMPVDIRIDTFNPTEMLENGDEKSLEKREIENAETSQVETNENTRRRRDETVTLLSSTGQPGQPNVPLTTTWERQPEHKREDMDRRVEAPPNASIISEQQNSSKTIEVNQSDVHDAGNRKNIEDTNARQHQRKDNSVDSNSLESGAASRRPEHEDGTVEVQKSNPEAEVTSAEEDDARDAFDESLDDIPEDERRDREPEHYQDDKDGDEVSEM